MQVQIKENAFSPVYIGNGQYILFSGIERIIESQETCLIDTKIMIHLPINYGALIVSGDLLNSNNIQTAYSVWSNQKDQTVTVMVTNLGKTKFTILKASHTNVNI